MFLNFTLFSKSSSKVPLYIKWGDLLKKGDLFPRKGFCYFFKNESLDLILVSALSILFLLKPLLDEISL